MASFSDARLAIEGLLKLGFSGAVLTPHLYHDVFDNRPEDLRVAFDSFLAGLRAENIEFRLQLAGEYFADEHFLSAVESGEVLHVAIGGERLVLVEFSYLQETPFATAALAALVARGYRPVIAHVERYRFVGQNPEPWLTLFSRYGAVLQGDIGSLAGQHGESVRKFALWLLGQNHVTLWGTDLHRPTQIARYIIPGLACLTAAGRLGSPLNPLIAELAA